MNTLTKLANPTGAFQYVIHLSIRGITGYSKHATVQQAIDWWVETFPGEPLLVEIRR